MANEAGLIPTLEWEAILSAQESGIHELHPETFFDCLRDIPITLEGRRGSKTDVKLHYSCEVRFYIYVCVLWYFLVLIVDAFSNFE